jgi:DegV family protein with EDD domain
VGVAVVTDGAASLPAGLADDLRIEVVPLHLLVDGADLGDPAIPLADVLARSGPGVHTSAPSPGEFLAALEPRCGSGDGGAVVVTVAGHVSASFTSAWLAGRELGAAAVRVVDSHTAAGAQALVVIAAAEAAAAGESLARVEARARMVADRVRLVATLRGLDHLARSGRVPGLAASAGRLLGLHPLFAFEPGGVRRLRPARSRTAALQRIVAACLADRPSAGAALRAAALHALAEDDAAALLAAVQARTTVVQAFTAEFTAAMAAHTGPGVVGLAWWWDDGGHTGPERQGGCP